MSDGAQGIVGGVVALMMVFGFMESCERQFRGQSQATVSVVQPQPQLPNDPSQAPDDCSEAAASRAGVLWDPLRTKCDPAHAVGVLGTLLAVGVAPEVLAAGGAEAAAAEELTSGRAAAGGAAAHVASTAEAADAGAAIAAPRAYTVEQSATPGELTVRDATPSDTPVESLTVRHDGADQYVVQRSGNEAYPVSVAQVGDDLFEVIGQDGSRTVLSAEQVDDLYRRADAQTWSYQPAGP